MIAPDLVQLRLKLIHLENSLVKAADAWQAELKKVHESHDLSAANLVHYLCLRSFDIRDLQEELHEAGLSALSNSESHILYQVQAILKRMDADIAAERLFPCNNQIGRITLQKNALQLFGARQDERIPFLMVTFDGSFAYDIQFIKKLLLEGMNVARINCAHDDEKTWLGMINSLRSASAETGISCKIYMDLAGPKLRTSLPYRGKKKGSIKVALNELLLLTETGTTSSKSRLKMVDHKVVSCSIPGIVSQLKPGQSVLFDDGLIDAEVVEIGEQDCLLKLSRISTKKPRLKAGKGINFPDGMLAIESLTRDDRMALPFIVEHADLVGYSFVRSAEDLSMLQEMLEKFSPQPPAVIIKIETREAFNNLPGLLLQAMTKSACGVMIARGDLAVEVGLERLSEIQEEILWICEAAHVPVIWATQVLESLNKSGMATRSEGTDAARAALAECVMINKGAYTLEVLKVLKNILHRSSGHRFKRRHLFRRLSVAENFMNSQPAVHELLSSFTEVDEQK